MQSISNWDTEDFYPLSLSDKPITLSEDFKPDVNWCEAWAAPNTDTFRETLPLLQGFSAFSTQNIKSCKNKNIKNKKYKDYLPMLQVALSDGS